MLHTSSAGESAASNPNPTQPVRVQAVGVIGGGQLAWMMAAGAKALGLDLVIQTPQATDPAVAIAQETILAPVEDATATAQLAQRCQVITFENEFVDLKALEQLADQGICFHPPLSALAAILDKYEQRCYLQKLGLPVPQFAKFHPDVPPQDLGFTFPLVLKARRHGYDGQGTFVVPDEAALQALVQKLQAQSDNLQEALLIEEFIPFEQELAVVAARSVQGDIVTYPVVMTQQENQVCRRVIAPADIPAAVEVEVEAIAQSLLNHLQVVGVLGIELFLTASHRVLVNELAPRTHNSGHFTLDACATSQFEQHLRAVAGLPLGSPDLQCPKAIMVNLLGFEHSHSAYEVQRQQLAALPRTTVHWYGKTESRPGRKLGHVTRLLETPEDAAAQAAVQEIEALWYGTQTA